MEGKRLEEDVEGRRRWRVRRKREKEERMRDRRGEED